MVDKHDSFQYPVKRQTDPTYIRDIHDGEVFKHLMINDDQLSAPHHTELIIGTDGVLIFKSSKGSLWPVYLMTTSIPPHLRSKLDNLIVAALWFGPIKPHMDILLKPVLEQISNLNCNPHSAIVISAKLVQAVFDLPAKAAATNTKQFNGEYGCLYCTDKGEIFNTARIYPPNISNELRTTEKMKDWAASAMATNSPQYGVKGKSILGEHIELPQCVPIDYMHAVLEGVFKQLMKLWFGPNHHQEPFSLRRQIPTINRLMSKIQPPKELQRLPRSVDQMAFFKASEYRAWLIFFALPILTVFLPPEYSNHLILLVSSMHILLSDKICFTDLDRTHEMLTTFYHTSGDLYSSSIYTINMHSLIHIVPLVRLWGPVWAYSMFGFENLNGYLGTTFHGTRRIVYQISFQIQLRQSLPDKLQEISEHETPEAKPYIAKLLNQERTNMFKIDSECYSIGKLELYTLSPEEKTIVSISSLVLSTSKVHHFKRLMLNRTFYSSERYTRKGSRSNSICSYVTEAGVLRYGKIKALYVTSLQSTPQAFSIIETFEVTRDSPLTNVPPSRNRKVHEILKQQPLSAQILPIAKTQNLIAVPLMNILRKCVLVKLPIRGNHAEYVIPLPNMYEIH